MKIAFRHWRRWWLLIVLLYLVIPAAAQEQTPEATPEPSPAFTPTRTPTPPATATPLPTRDPAVPEYIVLWSTTLIYPEAVRFNIVIADSLENIENVSLSITPPGAEAITVDVDPEASAIVTRDYTELAYVWEIPADSPPRFLTTVDYTWRVAAQDRPTAEVPGTFLFADDRVTWQPLDEPNETLNVLAPQNSRITRSNLLQRLRPVYDLLVQNRAQEQPPFNFILFDNALPINPCIEQRGDEAVVVDPFTATDYPCDPELLEAIFQASDLIPVQTSASEVSELEEALVSLMVEKFYSPLFANPTSPDWLKFGLEQFYIPSSKAEFLTRVRQTARVNGLYPLTQMNNNTTADQELWRAQAYSMVLYVAHEVGVSTLFELADAAEESTSFAQTYEEVTGLSLDALLPNLINWVYTEQATSDFVYTPYIGATAQPTPSNTRTPFPPTPSHTPTPTVTTTPTPTVTGVLSATPLPSPTPTFTRTPAPATVTPRPAGSLILPTPPPPPATVPAESTSTQPDPLYLGAVAALIAIVIAVVILLFQIITQRNR
ncbi:MAG: hypothetical protein SF029_14870 [bacterium]|nr:hypothetical protein [bacterium]